MESSEMVIPDNPGDPNMDDTVGHCLVCGQNLIGEVELEDEDMQVEPISSNIIFETAKYEQFLSKALLLGNLSDIGSGKVGISTTTNKDDSRHNEKGDENEPAGNKTQDAKIFCGRCQMDVIQLYQNHQNMEEAVRNYEEKRDKIALSIVTTFLTTSRPPVEFPIDAHKESVAKKWKKIYTGEVSKEKEVLKIVKEREHLAASRAKRFQKLKGSLASLRAKNGLMDSKSAKQIQRTMTSIYFTPKPQIVRKRKQMFLRVALPEPSKEAAFICPVCDKNFRHEYSLALHLRSHAAETGKLYKCSICERVCSSRTQLMQHRKDDHSEGEKIIKCDGCDATFVSRATFKAHVKTHVEIKTYNCDVCNKDFSSSYYLKRHVASHENVDFSVTDLFSCKKCSKTFLRSQDLNEHLKIHDDKTLVGCEFCGKGFPDEATYKQHSLIHAGGNPYICEECGLRYSSEALVVSHLKIHRPKGHVCTECGKACRSRDGLRKHQLIHTGKKPYSCHICNIGFIERKSFDAHMVKHTGKLPYKCNYCNTDEGFKDAKDLRRHKVTKHPEFLPADRKYTCDVCWNGFSAPQIMQEHKTKIHERYKCQHCDRVFKLGDHLRRHMYIHTGEKPYKCEMCDKTFNQESNLKEHMYRHTGIRPHRCPYCPGVGYLRRMHLKEHMVKEHGTDKVPTLPMGRAAQNARKSGVHPIPTTTIISGMKAESLNSLEGYSVKQSDIIAQLSGSKPSNCIILVQSKGNM